MITQPSFYAAAVPAVILLGLSKGGFAGLGVLGMPLMALTIPPVQAAAITLPILMVQDAFSVWVYRRNWDRTNLKILLPGAIAGIVAAYLLAAKVPDAAVALVLGHDLDHVRAAPLPGPPRRRGADARCGAEPAGRLVLGRRGRVHQHDRTCRRPAVPDLRDPTAAAARHLRRHRRVFFALVNLIKVPPYLALGQFSRENLLTSAVLFPLAIVSTWAGVWLVRRVSGERFYDLVYVLLLLLGAKLVFDGARWLLA